jgi:hypothetical protein
MYHAMVVGKTGVYRRWIADHKDPRIESGRIVTEALLSAARERLRSTGD